MATIEAPPILFAIGEAGDSSAMRGQGSTKYRLGAIPVRVLSIAVLLLALAIPCRADDWRGAQPFELRSPNGVYTIRVQPGSGAIHFREVPAQRRENAKATLSKEGEPPLTFLLLNPRSPVSGELLDDGTFLTFDNWYEAGYGAVLACYSPDGSVRWSHELEDLLSKERIWRVPRSISSRWWRSHPPEWEVKEDEAGTLFGFVTLWNEDKLRVRLSDGAVEYMEVQDLGGDPQRLLSRGEDLLKRRELLAAIETLNRAIMLKPDLLTAYRVLSEAYEDQENYDAAVKVLLHGIRENPAISICPSIRGEQSDSRLWLLIYLGRVYAKAGRLQDAEMTYRDCLRLDPGLWTAGEELAQILLEGARQEDADLLLAGFFKVLRGNGEGIMAGSDLNRAALEIGRVYQGRGQYERAKQYYLRAYDQEDVDLYLYLNLAKTFEALGEYKEAIAILQKLKAWRIRRAYPESYSKEAEKDLARVTEKVNALEKSKATTVSPSPKLDKPPSFH